MIEPTTAFSEQCDSFIHRWHSGELPFRDVYDAIKRLAEEASRSKNLSNQALAEYCLGYIQGQRSHYDISILHFQQARKLFDQAGFQKGIVRCYVSMGESYRHMGDFTRARQFLCMAYTKAAHLELIVYQTIARCNEGSLFLSLDQLESARTAFEEVLTLSSQWPKEFHPLRPRLLCELYQGLAGIHLREKKFDAAELAAKNALEIAYSVKQPFAIGHANRTMGEVLTQSPNTDENPEDYFKASITAFEELRAEGELARTIYAYACSLAKLGQRLPAARKLKHATLMFAKLGMVNDAARAAETYA